MSRVSLAGASVGGDVVVRVLFVGDVVGKVGRRLLAERLRRLQSEVQAEFTVVNVENAAGGFGLTGTVWEELARLPVDVFTSGNHIWDKKETAALLDAEPRLLRPANYPAGNPGRGWCTATVEGRRPGRGDQPPGADVHDCDGEPVPGRRPHP